MSTLRDELEALGEALSELKKAVIEAFWDDVYAVVAFWKKLRRR